MVTKVQNLSKAYLKKKLESTNESKKLTKLSESKDTFDANAVISVLCKGKERTEESVESKSNEQKQIASEDKDKVEVVNTMH